MKLPIGQTSKSNSGTACSKAICITSNALEKLALYVELSSHEISGLGFVDSSGDNLIITDVFILRQRCFHSYTELLPEAVAEFMLDAVNAGKDPETIKLWWHSHANMDVFWSSIDEYTARGFGNDFMLALVLNKSGDYLCRLDLFQPTPLTLHELPLRIIVDHNTNDILGTRIDQEIQSHVEIYSR